METDTNSEKKHLKVQDAETSKGKKIWRFCWKFILCIIGWMILSIPIYKFILPPLTPLMVQRFGQQLIQPDRKIHFERHYVKIEDISPNLVNAVVASEDGNFMHHNGFDFKQLKQSRKEIESGRRFRGGSTISMQTAKNAFLPHHRSYLRKALEACYTTAIEKLWGKKRIMEVYLNIIEFGDGIYGCEAASQHYFGHSAAKLTQREAAMLAVTLPSPLKRNPAHQTPFFRKQTGVIVGRASKYGRVNLDRERTEKDKKKDVSLFEIAKWMIFKK